MTYRAAIVGAGAPRAETNSNLEGFSIGYWHARGYLAHPEIDVVAVADINIDNARALAEFTGGAAPHGSLSEMLADHDIDILSVCTWPTLHCEMVLAAIDAGVKMILCEKPMAVSVDEIDRMVAAAAAAGVRLFVNHQRRYEQPFVGARQLIQDGRLGEIVRLEGFVGGGWDLMSWGSHWVDMARFFAADRPVEWVLAAAASSGNVRYGHRVEDQMLLQFGFGDGPLALIHTGAHTTGAGFIVVGTEGTLRLTGEEAVLSLSTGETAATVAQYFPAAAERVDGITAAIADIVAHTAAGTPSQIDGESGHADTEIIMAAYESARSSEIKLLPLAVRTADLRAPA